MTIFGVNIWEIAFFVLLVGIMITILPIIFAFRKKINLDTPKYWFKEADFLGQEKRKTYRQ